MKFVVEVFQYQLILFSIYGTYMMLLEPFMYNGSCFPKVDYVQTQCPIKNTYKTPRKSGLCLFLFNTTLGTTKRGSISGCYQTELQSYMGNLTGVRTNKPHKQLLQQLSSKSAMPPSVICNSMRKCIKCIMATSCHIGSY